MILARNTLNLCSTIGHGPEIGSINRDVTLFAKKLNGTLLIVAYLHASDGISTRLIIVVSRLKTPIKVTQRTQ